MNAVRIDPKKIPAQKYRDLARVALEFVKKHPELKEQYERETGKSFYKI